MCSEYLFCLRRARGREKAEVTRQREQRTSHIAELLNDKNFMNFLNHNPPCHSFEEMSAAIWLSHDMKHFLSK